MCRKVRNYMAYRTVKEFPVVGDAINKAVEHVATGRQSARDAMDAAQQRAIGDLRKAENQL
jgi:multiple sugar transport system substrate-binding protein